MGLQMQNDEENVFTKILVLYKMESIFIAYALRSKYISNFKLRYIHYILRSEILLFKIKWAIIDLYSWPEQVTFWWVDDVYFVLEQQELDIHSASYI